MEQTKNVTLSGPTDFTPIIRKLISYGYHCPREFTMLVIVTDELKTTTDNKALVDTMRVLSNLPNVCLLVIGVGDGPWERMSHEEHCLRHSIFEKVDKKKAPKAPVQSKVAYDNFHFVSHSAYAVKPDKMDSENYFARAIFRKLPTQLKQASVHDEHRPRA